MLKSGKEPSLSPLALKILEERYLLRDNFGRIIETPTALYQRVARTMGQQEKTAKEKQHWTETFLQGLLRLEWSPASPCLMNAGTLLQQLSACFILDIADSMENIFNTLKNAALIYKTGGGVGFNFGKIREKGALISTTKGYSGGTVSWLRVYDTAIEAIAQGGKRRGAALGLLPVDHPDILDWITAKATDREITNFNLSIAVTNEFMQAVKQDRDFPLKSPHGYVKKTIPARILWEKICYQAWASGEPGLFFIDRANEDNPNPHLGRINSGNPCNEFLAIPNSSCNLASINLARHLVFNQRTEQYTFSWEKFRHTIHTVVRFLDNMIDANQLPLPELREIAQATRPIGVGFMGLARVLKSLDLGYHTLEARLWAEKMIKFLREETEKTSCQLAQERGVYPAWKGSLWQEKGIPIRNSNLLSIAPTGTIATLTNTSFSLEPEFAPIYQRRILEGNVFYEFDPQLKAVMEKEGLAVEHYQAELSSKGSIQDMDIFSAETKKVFVYALDIKPKDHLLMQAVIQKHVDGAISKTINLPTLASESDVANAFSLAYDLKLKGCTVYRQGTRMGQVLSLTSQGTDYANCTQNHCPSC